MTAPKGGTFPSDESLHEIAEQLKEMNKNFAKFIQLAEGVDDEDFEELHKGGL